MTDEPKSPERTVHVKDAVEDADHGVDEGLDEGLASEKGPAQADADDPTMGGSSDGDTAP